MSTMPPSDDAVTGQNHRTQRETAYLRLRRLLALQQAPEGKRLREAEWATRLGVNRTALREAFARLEAEGYILKGPVTGYFVPALETKDVLEIQEVRLILENGALERIYRHQFNSTRHLKPLRQSCDELERMIRDGYDLGSLEADERFHKTLVCLAGNQRLATLYNRAPLPLLHPQVVSRPEWQSFAEEVLEDHRRIYKIISDGEYRQAVKLLTDHLTHRFRLPICTA